MSFQKEIESYLQQIKILEESFSKAKEMDVLPLSFFSSTIDTLNKLRTGIHEIEAAQLKMMQEHFKKMETELVQEEEIVPASEPLVIEEPSLPEASYSSPSVVEEEPVSDTKEPMPADKEKPVSVVTGETGYLVDKIGKKIHSDFKKSLSLNDRFMFQRDLFHGNADEMNDALEQLNGFQSLDDALVFLNSYYVINWESESGSLFRELLNKHFA